MTTQVRWYEIYYHNKINKKVCYRGLHSAPRVKREMHILPIGGLPLCPNFTGMESKGVWKNHKLGYLNSILQKLGVTHDLGWWFVEIRMVQFLFALIKLPHRGPGWSPVRKRILCTLDLSERHWWQSFLVFWSACFILRGVKIRLDLSWGRGVLTPHHPCIRTWVCVMGTMRVPLNTGCEYCIPLYVHGPLHGHYHCYHPSVRPGNILVASVSLWVCLSCSGSDFWTPNWPTN